MEWNAEHLYLLSTMLLVLVVGFLVIWFTKPYGHLLPPPGPLAWPILGHLHLLGAQPHVSLYKLSKQYGPLMGLRLGRIPTIVASSQEMAKEILQTHDLAFASRPRLEASVQLMFDCSDIAFVPHGPYWRFMRQLCVTDLLTTKRIEQFKQVREEEVEMLIGAVQESGMGGKKVVEVRGSLLGASNSINCRMPLGGTSREFSVLMKDYDLTQLVTELLCLLGVFHVGDYIPSLHWLDLQGYVKRMKKNRETWKSILQKVIDKRREARRGEENGSPTSFLDVLLDASASNKHNLAISDDNIKAVLLDLLTGGSDTTASTVEWALAELLNNPMDMKKVQEELDIVVGKSCLVKDAHIPKLPYLKAIVKEVFRLHPPTPLLIPHENTKECVIGGYTIPAKTRAYVNIWAIGRDPIIWERPLEFLPERFLDSNVDFHGQHFQFLPFGSGRRGCPGITLGMLNVHLMLASLLQAFTWSIPSKTLNDGPNMNQVDMDKKFGITMTMAKPLCSMATPRLSPHLL